MTVLDLPATAPPDCPTVPACEYCTSGIRLADLGGTWTWVHVDTDVRRCDGGPETCPNCGLPVRPAGGAYWVHSFSGAFPCPEDRRPLGVLTYAAPGVPAGFEIATPAEWRR